MSDLDFAAYSMMPDLQKKQLCIDLLAEFGCHDYNETKKGELQHQCTLDLGGHSDGNSRAASINYKKLTFKCYVCQNSGGLLWWIAVNRHESATDSRSWLRNVSGITDGIDIGQRLAILNSLFHPEVENFVMPSYDERVLDQWTSWPIHHPYLTLPVTQGGREIPVETLDRYRVGYCDHDASWHYFQRIIIPLRWGGKLVGWQARRLWPDDPEPAKYKNSPDVPRDRILFGDINQDEVVVVESPMSVLRHAHHLPIVATLGASVSDLQLPLLHRYRRVTLWMDNDKAGWKSISGDKNNPGLLDRLRPYVDVRVVKSPWAKADPADLTEAEAAALVDAAVPGSVWRKPDPGDLLVYQRSEEQGDELSEVRDGSGAGQ